MPDPKRREDDGTVFKYECTTCGKFWKVYQNPCNCSSLASPTKPDGMSHEDRAERAMAAVGLAHSQTALDYFAYAFAAVESETRAKVVGELAAWIAARMHEVKVLGSGPLASGQTYAYGQVLAKLAELDKP